MAAGWRRWALGLLTFACVACDGGGTSDPGARPLDAAAVGGDAAPPDTGAGGEGGGGEDQGAPPGDAAADAAVPQPDGAVIPPGGEACTFPDECPFGDCIEGTCQNDRPGRCADGATCPEGEVCGGFDNRYYCFLPCELDESCPIRTRACDTSVQCAFGQACLDGPEGGRCVAVCETDADCGERYCFDGICRPYPDIWKGEAPTAFGQPGQLYAGVATLPLDFPMGVEMAGYGGRPGPRNPYAFALGGSDRFFEQQDVRVIALSDDQKTVILIRLPLSWSTDYILSLVAQELQALTKDAEHPEGINYLDTLVTSATHSHSQVGRFWNIVPETGFGVFGHGEFSAEVVHRIAASVAGTVKLALDRAQPARAGWTIVDGFDPDRRIHSDRRSENPDFLDDKMLVLRVDDLEGQPLAALVGFALHGTHMEETWITGDAPGAVEIVATEKLSAQAGREVPVMFFNTNAGDVSPRGDDTVEPPWGKIQVVGHRAWPIFRDAFDGIETRADQAIDIVTRRIPISYRDIGYEEGEFRMANDLRPMRYGAFQCVQEGRPRDDPYEDGEYRCIIHLQRFRRVPVPEFMKTTLTAFRVGNLVVTTLPGEPTSQLGTDHNIDVQGEIDAAGLPYTAINIGYSQDHHLYLVGREDWLLGAYEASQNIWGFKFGEYISRSSTELAKQLLTPEVEANDTGIKPTWYEDLEDDTVAPTENAQEPFFLRALPADAERGDMLELDWAGGHPGVDLPYAVLEVEGEGGFATARTVGNLARDNSRFETLTIYRGDFEADHTWGLEWELPFDLPLGRYRVRVTGRVWRDGAEQPYELTTEPFTLAPARLVLREVSGAGGRVTVKANYPNGPTNDDGTSPFEGLQSRGHLLRADPEAHYEGAQRDRAMLLGAALPAGQTVNVAVEGMGNQASANVVPERQPVTVDLVVSRDAEGTEATQQIPGWPASQVSIAPPVPGTYTVTVRDAWGNVGGAQVDVTP